MNHKLYHVDIDIVNIRSVCHICGHPSDYDECLDCLIQRENFEESLNQKYNKNDSLDW